MALLTALAFALGTAYAIAPTNPPSDPFPSDPHPYPPTDAVLYYDREAGYLAGDFIMDIGGGVVEVKLVPRDLEEFAVGYFTEFWPGMPVSDALKDATNQMFLGTIPLWPRWFGDSVDFYSEGDEDYYWPGWRFYYEDLEWDANAWDRDLDDLWIDIAYQKVGSSIWIIVKASYSEAVRPNPFDITFERRSGDEPVHFSYVISEQASGGGVSSGSFVLDQDPVTIHLFDSGDIWDFAIFYGSVPALPAVAVPVAALACGLAVRRKRRAVV